MSWLFFLIYFFIFLFLIKKLKLDKYKVLNYKFLCLIFVIKIFIGVSLNIVYSKYYQDRKTSDIYKYFDDSKHIYRSLSENPKHFLQLIIGFNKGGKELNAYTDSTSNWKYQTTKFSNLTKTSRVTFSNHRTITKFNALVRVFSFGNINIHVLFMSFLSLMGCLLIFKSYYQFISSDNLIFYLLIVFFTPSILIWSSGILKEGLIVFGFGLFIYSIFHISNGIKYLLSLLLSIFLIFITKYYLVFILVPLATFYLIPVKSKKNILLKYVIIIVGTTLIYNLSDAFRNGVMEKIKNKRYEYVRTSLGGYYYIQFNKDNAHRIVRFEKRMKEDETTQKSNDYYWNYDTSLLKAEQGLPYQVFNTELNNEPLYTNSEFKYYFLDSFSRAGSYYTLPTIKDSFPNLLLSSLKATKNVFIKPFSLAKGSLMLRLASLENFALLVFMLFLLFKRSISLKNLNVLLFNLSVTLTLYLLIGLTVPVIGGLFRYKMIGFVLFLISLLIIFDKKKQDVTTRNE